MVGDEGRQRALSQFFVLMILTEKYGVHLRTKIIENKIQFEVQKLKILSYEFEIAMNGVEIASFELEVTLNKLKL